MPSMRRVRRDFRKEILRLISAGDGNTEKLMEVAGRYFGYKVGYELLIKTFLMTEVSNACSYLRNEDQIETVGRKWKLADALKDEDVDIISIRRLKRLRGELKAQIRLDHEHGRVEDAAKHAELLSLVNAQLPEPAATEETVEAPPAA